MKLEIIEKGKKSAHTGTPEAKEMYDRVQEMYAKSGFKTPWVGYFAIVNEVAVGSCGFKNGIANGQLEIAYLTFEKYQGKGYGKRMCKMLTEIATETDNKLRLTAQTKKDHIKSHIILLGNDFLRAGTVNDPVEGEVWEWEYSPENE